MLVAAHPLGVGERLDASSTTWRTWPSDGLDPGYITAGSEQIAAASAAAKVAAAATDAANATKAALTSDPGPAGVVWGAVVRTPLAAGEPIIRSKLVQAGSSGVMAVTLDPGMRAMSLPVTTESAAGGFIQPGDHVDVVLTRKLDPPTPGAQQSYASSTVMRNVRVMAIDQSIKPSDKTAATPAATATLELTSEEAQGLVLAHAQGDLTLVLRSYADGAGPPVHAPQVLPPTVVHVFRGGLGMDVKVAR